MARVGRTTPWTLVFVLSLLANCPSNSDRDPCAGVYCSLRGFCIDDQGIPYCACLHGFHPSGLGCERNDPDDPCLGVECSGHGTCRSSGDEPWCECAPGYRSLVPGEADCAEVDCGLVCLPQPPVDGGPTCDAVACNTRCVWAGSDYGECRGDECLCMPPVALDADADADAPADDVADVPACEGFDLDSVPGGYSGTFTGTINSGGTHYPMEAEVRFTVESSGGGGWTFDGSMDGVAIDVYTWNARIQGSLDCGRLTGGFCDDVVSVGGTNYHIDATMESSFVPYACPDGTFAGVCTDCPVPGTATGTWSVTHE